MKQLTSADFRKTYARESEPVEVTAYGKVIGTWFPADSEIVVPPHVLSGAPTSPPEAEKEPRMTIRPVRGPAPVLVKTTKAVFDPVEAARNERARMSELQRRMYGKKP